MSGLEIAGGPIDSLNKRLSGLRSRLVTLDDLPQHLLSEHVVPRLPPASRGSLAGTSRGMRSVVDTAPPDVMSVTERLLSKAVVSGVGINGIYSGATRHGEADLAARNYVLSPHWMLHVRDLMMPPDGRLALDQTLEDIGGMMVDIVYSCEPDTHIRQPPDPLEEEDSTYSHPYAVVHLEWMDWRIENGDAFWIWTQPRWEKVQPMRHHGAEFPQVATAALALLASRAGAKLSEMSVAELYSHTHIGTEWTAGGPPETQWRTAGEWWDGGRGFGSKEEDERMKQIFMKAHEYLQRNDSAYGQSMAPRGTGGQRRSRPKKASRRTGRQPPSRSPWDHAHEKRLLEDAALAEIVAAAGYGSHRAMYEALGERAPAAYDAAMSAAGDVADLIMVRDPPTPRSAGAPSLNAAQAGALVRGSLRGIPAVGGRVAAASEAIRGMAAGGQRRSAGNRCAATTRAGTRCTRVCHGRSKVCHQHAGQR